MNPSGPPGSFRPLEVTSEGSPLLGLVLCSIAKSPCPTSGQFHQHPGLPATPLCSEQPAGPVSSVQGLLPLDLPCASDPAPELDVQSPSWFGSIHVPSAPHLWSVSPEAALTSLRMRCSLQHPVRRALSSPSSFHPLRLGHPPRPPSCPPVCGRMSVLPAATAPSADPLCSPWRGMEACWFLCHHHPIPSL